ncbi:hypothetical protein PC128_g2098 [Phytophthora cactorum]|nr:hypothetical protein PC128_g2098 [Phytophthora cactorum]
MITRGTSDLPSAPTSPSSRTYIVPSDSDPQPASSAEEGPVVADTVDVTGTEEPWAAASARRTTEPRPLRPSKRLPAKFITGTALAEARKGKKTLIKRTAAGSSAAPPKKPTGDGERASGPTRRIRRCPRRLRDPGRRHQWRHQDQPTHRQLRSARRRQRSGPTAASTWEPSCRHSSPACADAETVPTAQSRTSAAAPDQVTVDMAAQLYALKEEVQQLRALGEIPPAELCYLTTASFPEGAKKAKGDYNPPQAHLLAASRMFRAFGTETGKLLTAMSFWSAWITWPDADASSEGAALEDGSTNSNFSSDCSPSANLPTATLQRASYEDILVALYGLDTFGHEVWYDHMCKLAPRLRSLVAKNKSAGPANTPTRVQLTLLYSSMFLGAALGHMQADGPQWWSGFCETLCGIDYQSPVWTLALVSALTQVKREGGRHVSLGQSGDFGRRDTLRRPAIPESMRRLIPINRKGQEPCLLNVAELPYSGGSRDRCGNPRRAHNWPDRLPMRFQEWIDGTYAARGQAEDGRQ